jgi:hypothetical protein
MVAHVPETLLARVIPMTTALNPSAWYSRLVAYKGARPEYSLILAALVYTYVVAQRSRIESLLGGSWSAITVVPSRRRAFDEQQLAIGIRKLPDSAFHPVERLRFRSNAALPRQTYEPSVFEPVQSFDGERLLLIEDLWVSGATSLSAAGALLAGGASSAVLLPLARMVRDDDLWTPDKYLEEMKVRYDPAHWPR